VASKNDDESRGLKYFGWYRTHFTAADLSVTAPHSNLYQAADAGADTAALAAAKAAGQDTLLAIESLFPGLKTSKPDFKTKWEPAVPVLRELLANNTIIGFNLGDELVCGGMKSSVLHEYANTVRASFPRADGNGGGGGGGATIWYNDCGSVVQKLHDPNYTIPAAIDWMSIDMYHFDGPVDNWVGDPPHDIGTPKNVLGAPGMFTMRESYGKSFVNPMENLA
jgi:hypothetical protein